MMTEKQIENMAAVKDKIERLNEVICCRNPSFESAAQESLEIDVSKFSAEEGFEYAIWGTCTECIDLLEMIFEEE